MNSKIEQSKAAASPAELVKYVLAVLLVVAGLFAFYWFDGQWPSVARVLVLLAALVAGVVVFMLSNKGGQTREFLSEARFELRKVVWPTRQEAMRTTWVVIAAVAILSLILAGIDVVIQWAVKFLLER